jgi:hypothetical protein
MSKRPNEVEGYRRPAEVRSISLRPEHPLYHRFISQTGGLEPPVEKKVGDLVAAAPRGGVDPKLNVVYYNDGQLVANALNEAFRNAEIAAEPLVSEARELSEAQLEGFKDAREVVLERQTLPTKMVTVAGIEMPVRDAYATLEDLQGRASAAESHVDLRHLEEQGGGVKAVILGIAITAFEASLWALVFNPTTLIGLLVLIAAMVAFASVNHFGLPIVGRTLRELLNLREARREAHNRGYSEGHLDDIDLEGRS